MNLKKLSIWLIAFGFILLTGFSCTSTKTMETAETETADTNWMFHDIVEAEFVAQYATVPMAENVMIIDARPKKAKYDKGHIPMAVNIPDTYFDKMADQLPENKDALLIYYCEGPTCKLSHKSAYKAEKLGYTNVKVYAGGFPDWITKEGHYAQVPAEYLKKHLDAGTPMLIVDSRPKKTKYDKGYVPSAINIPDSQFDKYKMLLPADKNTPLIFYCGGFKCKLSHKSADKAIALGYTDVKVFSAGYPSWKALYGAGTVAAAVEIKGGQEEGSISVEEFQKIVNENPESVYLVDVRDADEFASGALKTSVNIPVDELEKRVGELSSDKPIVFVCGTGARSGESFYMLQDIKPELKDVFYLDAELTIKKDGSFDVKKVM